MSLNYPLEMSFKILAVAPQIYIRDAAGEMQFYVKQKLFKLKEAIKIYSNDQQNELLYNITADRVIDFSARYNFSDAAGNPLGSTKRQGMKSLWRAHFDIFHGSEDTPALSIQEESVAVRMADGCANQIPFVGLFAGYFFNPTYLVTRPDGTVVMKLIKQPSLFEAKFSIEKVVEMDDLDEKRIVLSMIMMTLLEKNRG